MILSDKTEKVLRRESIHKKLKRKYLVFEIVNERYLESYLKDGDDAVDHVQLVWKVLESRTFIEYFLKIQVFR